MSSNSLSYLKLINIVNRLASIEILQGPPAGSDLYEMELNLTTLQAGRHSLHVPALSLNDNEAPDLGRFLASLPALEQSISRKADPTGLVFGLLNSAAPGVQEVGAAFWAWLCIVDDLTEESDEATYEYIGQFDANRNGAIRADQRKQQNSAEFEPDPAAKTAHVFIARTLTQGYRNQV